MACCLVLPSVQTCHAVSNAALTTLAPEVWDGPQRSHAMCKPLLDLCEHSLHM